jgi:hypothetical protein
MAEISLSSGSIVRPYRSPWGAFPTRSMPISSGVSSLAINLGQLVISDTRTSTCEHRIKASVVSGEAGIVGIAAEGASGSTAVMDTEISTAGDQRVLVTDFIDAIGDTGGALAFRFLAADRNSTNNSSVAFLALYGR